jgi:hypothetical protein
MPPVFSKDERLIFQRFVSRGACACADSCTLNHEFGGDRTCLQVKDCVDCVDRLRKTTPQPRNMTIDFTLVPPPRLIAILPEGWGRGVCTGSAAYRCTNERACRQMPLFSEVELAYLGEFVDRSYVSLSLCGLTHSLNHEFGGGRTCLQVKDCVDRLRTAGRATCRWACINSTLCP